ncbi:hypothetical protein [Hymenobacter cellulosivorans]|uniref:Uncharacterized protein n=1 Tax=Hymenobacter cellulosivorans TaxID=2932249 RepID=A0ABY4FF46_9BACT|nr:hypothetical protein [Hymenobacter cellulosivorans]UOQ54751.1 hypothetical protein MUN80_08325 [Hymenobacter cellulosivorans]
MRHLFSALALVSLLALPGCQEGCIDEAPAPACYSGKVVGAACMDGVLIEMDSNYPIGKAHGQHTNLVAGVNLLQQSKPELKIDGQVVEVGQTIYFTYTEGPNMSNAFCPQNTVPLPIPHLTLSNVSTVGCGQTKPD